MAQDSDVSKAGDKGKAKAVDSKSQEAPKDKHGKPTANGKKDEKPECKACCMTALRYARMVS